MPQHVCNGAVLQCSFGAAPSTLVVLPKNKVNTSVQPAANIMDHLPGTNIMPFGICSSPSNPAVIAATSAAMGVFTPAPCVPATPAPWIPVDTTVVMAFAPALDNNCTLNCLWAGVIKVAFPGQTTEQIP